MHVDLVYCVAIFVKTESIIGLSTQDSFRRVRARRCQQSPHPRRMCICGNAMRVVDGSILVNICTLKNTRRTWRLGGRNLVKMLSCRRGHALAVVQNTNRTWPLCASASRLTPRPDLDLPPPPREGLQGVPCVLGCLGLVVAMTVVMRSISP